jgi:putative transposase
MRDKDRVTKKCKRYNITGHAHELTFSCFHNRKFLSKKRTCEYLVKSISKARIRHDFSLWAYVFMPDHVHLLIHPRKRDYSISSILQSIKQQVAVRSISYLKRENPSGLKYLATGQQDRQYRFWQKGGGYDRNITRIDTLIETLEYIHLNPIRKGLVDAPEKWYYKLVPMVWTETPSS